MSRDTRPKSNRSVPYTKKPKVGALILSGGPQVISVSTASNHSAENNAIATRALPESSSSNSNSPTVSTVQEHVSGLPPHSSIVDGDDDDDYGDGDNDDERVLPLPEDVDRFQLLYNEIKALRREFKRELNQIRSEVRNSTTVAPMAPVAPVAAPMMPLISAPNVRAACLPGDHLTGVPSQGEVNSCINRLVNAYNIQGALLPDFKKEARRKVLLWFRNTRSEKTKRARKHIIDYYHSSGRLASVHDVNAELGKFTSDDPLEQEEVAMTINKIGALIWKNEDSANELANENEEQLD